MSVLCGEVLISHVCVFSGSSLEVTIPGDEQTRLLKIPVSYLSFYVKHLFTLSLPILVIASRVLLILIIACPFHVGWM